MPEKNVLNAKNSYTLFQQIQQKKNSYILIKQIQQKLLHLNQTNLAKNLTP